MNFFLRAPSLSIVRGCLATLSLCIAAPALADHAGPTGVGANGGLFVIGPETLARGRAAAGFRFAYVRPDQRGDAALVALAGDHVHAHNSDYTLSAVAGIAYGLTDRLTLSVELPFIRRDDLREGEHHHHDGVTTNEVVPLGSVSGIGDFSLIAKYKLLDRDALRFALIGGIKAPTGSTHRHSRAGERLETEHQPGSGSWDPLFGASFGAGAGPFRVTASALYQLAGKGAQDTRLGDRWQGGVALSRRFGLADHHDDAADEAPHGHAYWDGFVELTREHEGRQEIDGEIEPDSGGSAVWLSPGVRFGSAAGLTVAGSVGIPVWQSIRASHPDNHFRVALSIGRAF